MGKNIKVEPLTVTVSLSEGLAQSLCDLISRHALDLATIISDEFLRNLVARPKDSSAGLANDLVVTTRLSIGDFDAKISAALLAFRAELQVS
ncbi:MAG: hypothetical protein LKI03_06195 [Acetobacter indonesiensis]|jgi:hypothetical protein|nr:hypothetical protein [Acetobacter indonesiensis]MCI1546177.1 hypothetical protein [Acetobacter indonesiensis]MCI1765622.1 hypothetical protein [Acetobacter indonesiensis]